MDFICGLLVGFVLALVITYIAGAIIFERVQNDIADYLLDKDWK